MLETSTLATEIAGEFQRISGPLTATPLCCDKSTGVRLAPDFLPVKEK